MVLLSCAGLSMTFQAMQVEQNDAEFIKNKTQNLDENKPNQD